MMVHRTVKIDFSPSSTRQWAIYHQSRAEAARLWNDLLERHFRIRRANWKWPSKGRWEKWAKGRYPHLHSQTVQQIISEFLEAVEATRRLRQNGLADAKYPWRKRNHRDIPYTNQGARIREGFLLLPNGLAGTLRIKLPRIELPGRLMEVRLCWHKVLLVFQCPDPPRAALGPTIGVDLGVNTLIAATDGEKVVSVSGRALKADLRYRHKKLGRISGLQAKKTKRSRRWRKLQKRKARMLAKSANRVRDKIHKATRQIADEFPNAQAYVGKPFNDAAQQMGRRQAQTVASAANARIIAQLGYKLAGAIEIDESYTSQTCPVCGERSKHQRTYRCPKCGLIAPRDIVGCVNIRTKGMHACLLSGQRVPVVIKYKYPGKFPGSSGGHPASCSLRVTEARSPLL
jgi:putative transposase